MGFNSSIKGLNENIETGNILMCLSTFYTAHTIKFLRILSTELQVVIIHIS